MLINPPIIPNIFSLAIHKPIGFTSFGSLGGLIYSYLRTRKVGQSRIYESIYIFPTSQKDKKVFKIIELYKGWFGIMLGLWEDY